MQDFELKKPQLWLVLRAYSKTEYARKRNFVPPQHLTYESFCRIPLLEAEDLVENPEALALEIEKCVSFQSHGTTGRRKTVYVPMEERTYPLPEEIEKYFTGEGAVFAHSKRERRERFYWIHDKTYREIYKSATFLEYGDVETALRVGATGKALCLYDYPSAVKFFLTVLQSGLEEGYVNRKLLEKDAVFIEVTGEPLSSEAIRWFREAGEDIFGVEPFLSVTYGLTETGLVAYCDNPQHDLTYNIAERVFVELVDDEGRPLPPGDVGEVVVTVLNTSGTIVLRYRTRDLAVVEERGGKSLLKLLGRRPEDTVAYVAGSYVSLPQLSKMLEEKLGIPVQIEAIRSERDIAFVVTVPPLKRLRRERVAKECLRLVSEMANLSQFDLLAQPVHVYVRKALAGGKGWRRAILAP